MYLTLYLRCIQTWAGNIVSQCIRRRYALYFPSRTLTRTEIGLRVGECRLTVYNYAGRRESRQRVLGEQLLACFG